MFRNHMSTYDVGDVMHIVVPVDVTNSSALEKRACHVLDDHSHSHPAHVANSCTWYNLWVDSDYVHQNMAITLTLVQHDTDEELWLKCLETCEEHAPVQQGGPLMLFLILQRVQDRSEQTLDVLKMRAAQLDISKLKGEDVEQAARLIKSTHRVLKSSSTDSRSYVPRDFVKTVMFVLQAQCTNIDAENANLRRKICKRK